MIRELAWEGDRVERECRGERKGDRKRGERECRKERKRIGRDKGER